MRNEFPNEVEVYHIYLMFYCLLFDLELCLCLRPCMGI